MAGRATPASRGLAPVEPTTHPLALLQAQGRCEGLITMSEEAKKARQALQESMDLREQGHTDD